MITGNDLRRFRLKNGLSQIAFGKQMGCAQPTLSQIEAGTTPVSDRHIATLLERFDGAGLKQTFRDFMNDVKSQQAQAQAALSAPESQYLALKVWKWGKDFDLARVPSHDQAVDMVMIRAPGGQVIALHIGETTDHFADGEILVFERVKREDVHDGDLCLVQVAPPKSRGPRTMLAIAHIAPRARTRSMQLQPISPAGPIFTADDEQLAAVLRLVYRARYLHEP